MLPARNSKSVQTLLMFGRTSVYFRAQSNTNGFVAVPNNRAHYQELLSLFFTHFSVPQKPGSLSEKTKSQRPRAKSEGGKRVFPTVPIYHCELCVTFDQVSDDGADAATNAGLQLSIKALYQLLQFQLVVGAVYRSPPAPPSGVCMSQSDGASLANRHIKI